MIEGEADVHHGADGDSVVDDDGPLDDGLGVEDGGLRVIDDALARDGPECARVVDGERSSLHVCYVESVCPCLGREFVDGLSEFRDAEVIGVRDDGDEEAPFGCNCDTEVDVTLQYDGVVRPR